MFAVSFVHNGYIVLEGNHNVYVLPLGHPSCVKDTPCKMARSALKTTALDPSDQFFLGTCEDRFLMLSELVLNQEVIISDNHCAFHGYMNAQSCREYW